MPIAHLTMEGLSKILALGFSIYPITILVWESKGPNRKGRTEKAAPMSKRKFTSLPSVCSHPAGRSRGVIWTSPFAGVSQATGHHQSSSPGRTRKVKVKSFSRVRLSGTPWTVAHQAPLSTRFSRQEYCSGLPCPPPGDLPDPETEPASFYTSCTGRQVLYH